MGRNALTFAIAALAAGALAFAAAASAFAQTDERDHPLVGRFEGAEIIYHSANAFDEALLLSGKMDRSDPKADGAQGWTRVEGKVTKIRYEIPQGRSSLEAFRNHEAALRAKGFAPAFACVDVDCMLNGTKSDIHEIGAAVDSDNENSMIYFDRARYALMRRDDAAGPTYVALFVGERQQRATAFVHVVEPTKMETGKIAAPTAQDMRAALETSGHVDIHSILFDFDKDTLKPESNETIAQIARLLEASPQLRLAIVGHTDDQGGRDYNLALSRRRAAAVLAALVGGHRVDPKRLTSRGEGLSRPIAPNDTEDGRALNRRVELLKQ
jgi:outer membrane protein OmpA-like peptidoglycan-associated protein